MFSSRVIISIFAFIFVVNAQTLAEINQTPPCILNCVVNAAAEVGCPFNMDNTSCVCGSAQAQKSTSICLQRFCTADEIKAAAALHAQKCSAASSTSSGTNATSTTGGTAGASTSPTQATFRSAALMLTNSGVMTILGVIFVGFLYV